MTYDLINFFQIATLLKPAANCNDEAFEFRWLNLKEPTQRIVLLEASREEDMIRCTFPFDSNIGRGRVWLKRVNRKIDEQDIAKLLEISLFIARRSLLQIRSSRQINSLINRLISTEQLLNIVNQDGEIHFIN